MTDPYNLTIIMSNYNQERYIPKAIESVLSQVVDFKFLLIIVDDYSCNDRSKELIKQYVEKYDNVEAIFSSINQGYLSNILQAKAKTKTKYFCLLDADDYWTDRYFLQRAFDFLSTHNEFSIYESNVMVHYIEENGNEKTGKSFISHRIKSGVYSKEMLLNNERIPITQTAGMVFRNTIFINGIPEIMRDAIGTRSERSFEGDTGRFIMHLKTGLAYYDNRIVGVYRINPNGIWSSMSQAGKLLISSRSYIDFYSFYKCDVDYFVSKSYYLLQRYIVEKKKEIEKKNWQKNFMDEYEILMIDDIYQFCKKHCNSIITEKVSIKSKLKQIVQFVIS